MLYINNVKITNYNVRYRVDIDEVYQSLGITAFFFSAFPYISTNYNNSPHLASKYGENGDLVVFKGNIKYVDLIQSFRNHKKGLLFKDDKNIITTKNIYFFEFSFENEITFVADSVSYTTSLLKYFFTEDFIYFIC